jgi:tetratricopeptide (TPR) repeat protein
VKKPQWITVGISLACLAFLYFFGRTEPHKKPVNPQEAISSTDALSADSIITQAKTRLTGGQLAAVNHLESVLKNDSSTPAKLQVYHELAHFWADTGRMFEPYAWYESQSARLENSEKSLTFAAHLFLQNLRGENDPSLKTWKALQAKELFERSLKINPQNDSSVIGLGACYIFGGISASPMEGILKVRSVADRDSSNLFAQEILGQGSMISGQYDRAIARFQTIYRAAGDNADLKLESCLMLAEAFERKADKNSAIHWYEQSLGFIKNSEIKTEVARRIEELKK